MADKQPTITIGTIGHVARGKSSLVKQISGIATQKHSSELKRNITIKLGYANAKIYKCESCEEPECYQSDNSKSTEHKCNKCNKICILMNHISFVDCPGHNDLMKVMLNGKVVMDYTILIESVDTEDIPAPQTKDHLIITEYSDIPNAFVCINKIDLISKDKTKEKVKDLVSFLKTTPAKNSPIIPISATHGINMDVICELLAKLQPPERFNDSPLKMYTIRSFNANKPKTLISDLKGGVVGGAIVKGTLKIGDNIIIYPGYISKKKEFSDNTWWNFKPIECNVKSIQTEDNILDQAIAGGLISAQLDIDPALTADNKLIGQVILDKTEDGDKNGRNNVYEAIEIEYTKIKEFESDHEIKKKSVLVLNINSSDVIGTVEKVKENILRIELEKPIYIEKGDNITISHTEHKTMEILGIGKFIKGVNSLLI